MELILRPDPEHLAQYAQQKGLSLSAADAAALADAHACALRDTRRIEIEGGFSEALIDAFCDSPWLDGADQPCALTELFYHMKNETRDCISDERLLSAMRRIFDGPCRGSVELLADHMEGHLT